MTAYRAFLKKEFLELGRTGKIVILGILFLLFGIMNPAFAKLTPLIMELSEESLKEIGMSVPQMVVNDMTSWTQYLENTTLIMIIFVLIFSGSVTGECQKGTLLPVFTRGIRPSSVLLAKATSAALVWTAGYGLMFGVTYGYNQYFWQNQQIKNVAVLALAFYVFGLMLITLLYLMSVLFSSNVGVMLGTAAVVAVMYLLGMIPKLSQYLPTKLLSLSELAKGNVLPEEFTKSFLITLLLTVSFLLLSLIHAKRLQRRF